MNIILIRHGMTEGNKEKRYIGRTDEPLCSEGFAKMKEYVGKKRYPKADAVYVSPLKRCIETARLIYPDQDYILCSNLTECDFGDFENKNYLELSKNEDYKNWIESGGKQKFPSGEDPEGFKKRCQEAFKEIVEDNLKVSKGDSWKSSTDHLVKESLAHISKDNTKDSDNKAANKAIALIVHGGTIMAILEKYGLPEKGFYDWQLSNGEGYECELMEYTIDENQLDENQINDKQINENQKNENQINENEKNENQKNKYQIDENHINEKKITKNQKKTLKNIKLIRKLGG